MDADGPVSGGVCIFTSNSYPSTPLVLHTNLQAVAIQVYVKTLVTVCCVYLPPRDIISQEDLNSLVDQLPEPFILLSDFNGHSILWGNEDTNSRGQQIEQLISDHCLCLVNSDEKTYFHALALAICSPALLPLLTFTVGSDLCNSDHFPIFTAHADSVRMAHRPSIYIFQRADWGLFKQLATITDAMIDCADISDAVTQVSETILYAADVAILKILLVHVSIPSLGGMMRTVKRRKHKISSGGYF
ncbi:hypothetical protein AVEN_131063-1 [Araneus ventricosus]|uniref:Endonuclease/exonuclease/phosphatase domain-containing protein n=1 Tax=Araneus ventricosus TaxID=182803 RepID=A0A4Y2PVG4_ARAVE|nr:hypothetical protein AVEN_131063-1 [Araneus ventricosus]